MISADVVIITRAELDEIKRAAFQRGVARGRFEAARDSGSDPKGEDASAAECEASQSGAESASPTPNSPEDARSAQQARADHHE